ncbi:hypothetical protein ACIQZG_19185 [Lysinibacillus sp. NPDC096418]|uniref:hypothetical protein n=1 Tax=Lysinibacillus sp. NPDC096418 TaxID=3364138 RepID=UPI00381E515E
MRNFISVFIIIVVVVLVINIDIDKNDSFSSNNDDDDEKQGGRIASVLDNVWDEFGLFSFQIGDTDPIIWIVMDETKSEVQLKKYLEENVNKTDLSHYNIEITKRSLQEVETEWFMRGVSDLVSDYIQEKNYNDVELYHPSIEPEPILKITIPEYSELSSESLKMELEDLLVSKNSELPKKIFPIKYRL